MSTQQKSQITADVRDYRTGQWRDVGVFETKSGGDVEAEPSKNRSGGMGRLKSHKALPDYSDITIGRVPERTDHELGRWLMGQCGLADMRVSETPLGDDGLPWGDPKTALGTLMTYAEGDADSNSSDTRPFEITMQTVSIG